MTKIFWACDSTVQDNSIQSYPCTGIGQVFSLYLKEGITVENHAVNGKSTKSFIDESRLVPIYDRITAGDFLFIQFGHNDEKKDDPSRYTEPFHSYMENLEKFVNVARNKNAYPVLITPLERRCFGEEGVLKAGEHGDYVLAMKRVAGRLNVPLVDLWSMSREAIEKAGTERTKKWYMHLSPGVFPNYPDGLTDNTHLQYAGAVFFAGCIARGMKALGGRYSELILSCESAELLEREVICGTALEI
ncbi:MAG: rhamnogalacturonan acetylesterase [Clostridiales bacterium]|nr:rhamnogalacturonan acetylesterase [Clostridiales bacterium]